MSASIAEVLHDCRLFSFLKPESFDRLTRMARVCTFQKGERIFRQGEECPGAYVVATGTVRVFKTAPNGKEHVLHLVGSGDTFAEVAAIGGFNLPANAEAVVPTTCVLLPADLLRQALQESHALCLEMLTGLTLWVRRLVNLIEDVVLRDAMGRLAHYLLRTEPNADGTIELPSLKRHVASHLNLTSETFSRTLGRLAELGLVVELDGGRLELRDRAQLSAIARGETDEAEI